MVRKILASALLVAACGTAHAGKIVSAVGAVINAGAPGYGRIEDTYSQAGLSAAYVSDETDFDAYLATNPTHIPFFANFEWFSNDGLTSASVTYDLGMVRRIGAVALWNEEVAGIGNLNLYYSLDGFTFTALATGLTPTDHPENAWYPADVFRFAPVDTRYIRFDMSNCPQGGSVDYCAIGEVAFDSVPVPEPGPLGLLGLGLAALAGARRRAV